MSERTELNERIEKTRRISPSEFIAVANDPHSQWLLLHQLAVNISYQFPEPNRAEWVADATLHAYERWGNWDSSRNGFSYFTTVIQNRMKRLARNETRDHRRLHRLGWDTLGYDLYEADE